jgi:nitrate/TMAO reductase-like tetraheme cytochrome c subunit
MFRDRIPKSRILLEGRVPRPWLVGVLLALGAVLVVAIVGFSALNNVSTCETCHLIKPEVETYKQSAHYRAGVGCQKCHTKPGVFNYLIRNLQGVTNLILYVSNTYERPLTTMVGTNNCVQCHPKSQLERDQVFNNIRVNHTGLREAGYQCVTCHANISHPGTQIQAARVSQNKMPICARCHDGVRLPDDCSVCHVGGAPPEEINVPIEGRVTPEECAGCHRGQVICAECHHGLDMPHPAGWLKQHGPVVNDRGKGICVSCHLKKDPRFCIDCHGVQIPHPSDWVSRHSTVGEKDPRVCVKCHGKNACISCHGLQMPHPSGWLSTHPSTALSSPSTCTKCHSSSFCVNCHGVELPHGSAFINDHPNHVYNSGSVCMKCHGNGGTGPHGCYGGQCHVTGDVINPAPLSQ